MSEAPEEDVEELKRQNEAVRSAVEECYKALDKRQHGVTAIFAAFRRIEDILGMSWHPRKIR